MWAYCLYFSLILFDESKDPSMPPIVWKIIPVYSDLKIDIGLLYVHYFFKTLG